MVSLLILCNMHLKTDGSIPNPLPFTTIFDFIIGLAVYFDSEVIIGSPVTEKAYVENTVDFVLRVKEKVEFYEESG